MTELDESPFLDLPRDEWVAANRSAFAIRDGFPVTPGHSLVIPRRLIETFWEASATERADMLELVDKVKADLDEAHEPDGYNVGFNAGSAAGQTVPHLHIHVIPRHHGDVADPRGGIRHVIPTKGNYLEPDASTLADVPAGSADATHLVDGLERELLPLLRRAMEDPTYDRIDIVVSFVRRSGVDLVLPELLDALHRGANVRLLTTDYLGITEPAALRQLHDAAQDLPDQVALRVFHDPNQSFHPKAYIFWSSTDHNAARSIVGSSNLTRSGLSGGIEWNVGFHAVAATRASFDRLWEDERSLTLTEDILEQIEATPRPPSVQANDLVEPEAASDESDEVAKPQPHGIQQEALQALADTRHDGQQAGLVVMASGLGKTFLAAFDVAAVAPDERVLFVAHREEILRQARNTFRRVIPDASMGLYTGDERSPSARIVFASVQSLARHLDEFDAAAFSYVVIDEFHHAAADSYRAAIDYFDPDFLLGLTATPDRLDGASILALCNDNEVYTCDLVQGIDRGRLSPFRYLGLSDPTDYAEIPWRNGRFDPHELDNAYATQQRAKAVYNAWSDHAGGRTMAFCISQTHADFMAGWFEDHGVRAVSVHSGATSAPRNASVRALAEGDLDVLFAVDLFNEGLDLPSIDTILMLRPTASPVVFMQQLGRGLRVDESKDEVVVIDLIGNHHSFLLRPRVLLTLALGRAPSTDEVVDAMRTGDFQLPEFCQVDFDLEVVALLGELARQRAPKTDLLHDYLRTHLDETGMRATKTQALRAGLNPSRAATKQPWFEFLADRDLLDEDEAVAHAEVGDTLEDIERVLVQATKSYKMVTLRALAAEGALRSGMTVDGLVRRCRRIMTADPRLLEDVRSPTFPDPVDASDGDWEALWRKNPIDVLTTPRSDGTQLFRLEDDRMEPTYSVPGRHAAAFDATVAELVEYRLARYLRDRSTPTRHTPRYVLNVSHAGGKPIIRYDRSKAPELPEGQDVPFEADGQRYRGDFVKIALNVARREGHEEGNDLHELLRGWFGPNAGHPGTSHRVVAERPGDYWAVRPQHAERESVAVPLLAPGDPTQVESLEVEDRPEMEIFKTGVDPDRDAVLFARSDDEDGRWKQADLVHVRDEDGEVAVVGPLLASEFNPLERHVGSWFHRHAVPGLFSEEFNPGNWNSGHVSLGEDIVLFVTLKGGEYDNRLLGPDRLYWYSQRSASPTSKKGREILEAPDTGERIHVFLRAGKGDFAYAGLATPIDHEGEKPIAFTYALHTPLDSELQRALSV